jgi:hypothetical protein
VVSSHSLFLLFAIILCFLKIRFAKVRFYFETAIFFDYFCLVCEKFVSLQSQAVIMGNSENQRHNIRFQVTFMWLYFFVVYVPFFIYLIINHDVKTMPMSVIGWNLDGMRYLILYLILTLPFCLFLLFFFNRHFIGNNKLVKIFSIASCVLLTIGSFIPIENVGDSVLLTHTIVCVASSILLMLTILFALILHAIKTKYKTLILSLYGIYAVTLLIGFYVLYTAALFQLTATVGFFLILLFINTGAVFRSWNLLK